MNKKWSSFPVMRRGVIEKIVYQVTRWNPGFSTGYWILAISPPLDRRTCQLPPVAGFNYGTLVMMKKSYR